MFNDLKSLNIERNEQISEVEASEDTIYDFGTFIDGTCIDKKVDKQDGIGVLNKVEVNTSNDFLNISQEKVKQQDNKEKIRISQADTSFPYKKNDVLTDAEKQLYHFMLNNLCQINKIVIFPKVRLADIITLDETVSTNKNYLWKITNKHVDYLICDAHTLDIICVVELDDYTHLSQTAIERDQFVMQALQTCGIPTYRVRSAISVVTKSDLELIDDHLNTIYAPKCPDCHNIMLPKKNRRNGLRFFACIDNINCRKTIPIDTVGEKLP